MSGGDVPVRDAATVILLRDAATRPRVLMGQRGAKAAFMPSKYVFPGGAVDPGDARILAEDDIRPEEARRLSDRAEGPGPGALLAAAIREVWEETGLILGRPGGWRGAPPDWAEFAATSHVPSAEGLSFVFRAITPPGRPRRFDARFFLADAARIAGDPDDFTRATDELSGLEWIELERVRGFALPFITEVVLAEIAARLPDLSPPHDVPFFYNDAEESLFRRLGRTSAE